MALRYNKTTNHFLVATNDTEKAERCGLTLSTKAHTDDGRPVYYTANYDKTPAYNPYAVLPFYDEGDAKVKDMLRNMKHDFDLSWQTESEFNPRAPSGKSYLPYQRAGIEYGVEKRDILIGDEPGLGKTIQALGICNELEHESVLVVCPASIRLNWLREIKNWYMNDTKSIKVYQNSKEGMASYNNIAIVSYELAKNEGVFNGLMERKWDTLIIDEAHYLKTMDAARTRAIFGGGRGLFKDRFIAQNVDSIIALTGTPLPNRPRECYTLARALCPEAIDWMSYEQFCYRFNPSAQIFVDDKLITKEERGRLPELQARLRSNFMIRRLKADVLKDLPDKRYELAYVEPDGVIRDIIRRERMLNFKISDLMDPRSEIMGMLSTLRREMGEAKVPRVVEHIKYLFDTVEVPKIVLFAHHRSVMDALAAQLHKYGVVQVRGGMSSVAKDKSVQSFQTDPNLRLFMGQMDSAGFGIDGLQNVCDHVVFAEPAWVPGTNEQAVDRCHRIGQHNNVLAQFLVVEGSLDERILATVLRKNETIYDSLDRSH
jgi:SWI/SNF-related matrix-associated actin-dependent regulator 1 of chromatin subfamily A